MRFALRFPGVDAVRLHPTACSRDDGERGGQRGHAVGQMQQTAGEDGFERADDIGAIGPVHGLIALLGRRHAGEDRVQIVGKDPGGKVLLEGQMGESGGASRRSRCLRRLKASSTRQRR